MKKHIYSIYSIRNIAPNHKRFNWRYIGRTTGFRKIREHKRDNHRSKLGQDLRNPKIKFDQRILWSGTCTKKEIDNLEEYYIHKYKCVFPNGYNITSRARGASTETYKTNPKLVEQRRQAMIGNTIWLNRKHSEKTKKKMSENSAMKRPEVAAKLRGPKPWVSERMRGENNPMKRPEVAAKLRGPKPWVSERMRGDKNHMKRPEVVAKFKTPEAIITRFIIPAANRHKLSLIKYLEVYIQKLKENPNNVKLQRKRNYPKYLRWLKTKAGQQFLKTISNN